MRKLLAASSMILALTLGFFTTPTLVQTIDQEFSVLSDHHKLPPF